MKKLTCLALLLIGTAAINAQASIIVDFEDLTLDQDGGSFGLVPPIYKGLSWSSAWEVTDNISILNNPGHPAPSGTIIAYNGGDPGGTSPLTITREGGGYFNYEGASFSTFLYKDAVLVGPPDSSPTIRVEGYVGGVLYYQDTYDLLNPLGFVIQPESFSGIDKLMFFNGGSGTFWMMDNLQYSPADAPIPEPTSLLLLGSGVIGIALFVRKKD